MKKVMKIRIPGVQFKDFSLIKQKTRPRTDYEWIGKNISSTKTTTKIHFNDNQKVIIISTTQLPRNWGKTENLLENMNGKMIDENWIKMQYLLQMVKNTSGRRGIAPVGINGATVVGRGSSAARGHVQNSFFESHGD